MNGFTAYSKERKRADAHISLSFALVALIIFMYAIIVRTHSKCAEIWTSKVTYYNAELISSLASIRITVNVLYGHKRKTHLEHIQCKQRYFVQLFSDFQMCNDCFSFASSLMCVDCRSRYYHCAGSRNRIWRTHGIKILAEQEIKWSKNKI